MTPEKENARTLAALLNIDEEKATELLDTTVLVTHDRDCASSHSLAEMLVEILSRTVEKVTLEQNIDCPSVEIVIGNTIKKTASPAVYIGITDSYINVSHSRVQSDQNARIHPVFLVLGACHASAMAINNIIGGFLPYKNKNPIILDCRKMYGKDLTLFHTTVPLGEAFLAGAGAIGNALLYSLRFFNIEGKTNIVDPDIVSEGNLNRCLFFSKSDIGQLKASVLAQKAQRHFQNLELVPYPVVLQKVPQRTSESWLRRLIVGVDSRRARRALQREIPCEVFDASTTDIREVVLHFHRQPTNGACLSCIYYQNEGEISHEHHISEVLGVSVEEVRKGFVSEHAAKQILILYPNLSPDKLVNQAYDSLFKQLCGQGKLKTAADKQVLAPFAFVSVLAGAYLAIEIILRVQKDCRKELFNYWKVSPWHSPNIALRKKLLKKNGCEFCGDSIFTNITRRLWES